MVNNMIEHEMEGFINTINGILLNQEPDNSSKTFWQVMGRFMENYYTPFKKTRSTDYGKSERLLLLSLFE